MLYTPMEIWIVAGVFVAALFAGLVTWAFATLGKPPKGYASSEHLRLDPVSFLKDVTHGYPSTPPKPVVFDDVLACEPKADSPALSAGDDAKPVTVEIEMELRQSEVEGPMPEELRELYAEDKHSAAADEVTDMTETEVERFTAAVHEKDLRADIEAIMEENTKLKDDVARLKLLYPQFGEANQTVRRLMGALEDATITQRELRLKLKRRKSSRKAKR